MSKIMLHTHTHTHTHTHAHIYIPFSVGSSNVIRTSIKATTMLIFTEINKV